MPEKKKEGVVRLDVKEWVQSEEVGDGCLWFTGALVDARVDLPSPDGATHPEISHVELCKHPEGHGEILVWVDKNIDGLSLFCTGELSNTAVESVMEVGIGADKVKEGEEARTVFTHYVKLNASQVAYLFGESDPGESDDPLKRYSILQYFSYRHLPNELQVVSAPFFDLAYMMYDEGLKGPEVEAGLRKLLEAKDCFVRAAVATRKEK